MGVDAAGLGAVCLVAGEFLALGWLSGISFPPSAHAHVATWAARLLVGALLVGAAQLLLAAFGLGFRFIPVVLAGGAGGAPSLRPAPPPTPPNQGPPSPPGPGAPPPPPFTPPGERRGWLLLGALVLAALVRSILVP